MHQVWCKSKKIIPKSQQHPSDKSICDKTINLIVTDLLKEVSMRCDTTGGWMFEKNPVEERSEMNAGEKRSSILDQNTEPPKKKSRTGRSFVERAKLLDDFYSQKATNPELMQVTFCRENNISKSMLTR